MNMNIWEIFAYVGMFVNDFLAIMGALGSFML